MSNFELVDPQAYDHDLQSVYSAYIGHFQINNIPWYDRSWSSHFISFEQFLAFSWPAITVTNAWTGKSHVCVRSSTLDAFLKMIKQRYNENLPHPPNITRITPFENNTRPLRRIDDLSAYKKLHATLPAIALSAFKSRVRSGEPKAVRELWAMRDKTFLAIDFEWSERNPNSCLEWGYAAVRCGHIDAAGQWPPVPDSNYRKGHYIVSEYVDKVHNKHCPTHPWQYAFGDSLVISKSKLSQVIEAVITSMSSPESETVANTLVLVAHGIHNDLKRLEEMKIKIPSNMLIVDTASFEKSFYTAGERPPMLDPTKVNQVRAPGTMLSLENLLISFTLPSSDSTFPSHRQIALPDVLMHNSGNDAFLALFAMQMLLDPSGTQVPTAKRKAVTTANGLGRRPNGLPPLLPPILPPPRSTGGGGSPQHSPKRTGNRASMLPPLDFPSSPSQLSPKQLTPPHNRSRTTSGTGLLAPGTNNGSGGGYAKAVAGGEGTARSRTKSAENDLAAEFGAMARERKRVSSTMTLAATWEGVDGAAGIKQERSRSKSPGDILPVEKSGKEKEKEKEKEKKTKRRSSTMDFVASLTGLGGK